MASPCLSLPLVLLWMDMGNLGLINELLVPFLDFARHRFQDKNLICFPSILAP